MGEKIITNIHEATIQEVPWDLYIQETTQRIKSVCFDRPSAPDNIGLRSWEIWEEARREFSNPLVQVRAIMPMAQEGELLNYVAQIHEEVQRGDAEAWVPARIPLDDNMAIYYAQIACNRRPSYQNGHSITHEEAVAQALEKGPTKRRPLPEGFSTKVLEWPNCHAHACDILTNNEEPLGMEEIARDIAELHRRTFKHPHDPEQQTVDGVCRILENNPVGLVLNPNGGVVSAAIWEQDKRLASLVFAEQTYLTDLDPNYQGHGFSSDLRHATRRLTKESDKISVYGGRKVLPYVESITGTSFILSLRNGFQLAGTPNGRITGNLGKAYTAIGDAFWENGGLHSMGVTFARE